MNLYQKQTSEIFTVLTVVAVMRKKKVLNNVNWISNFIKKQLQHRCFPMNFTKILRTPFLTEHYTLVAASGSKQSKPMETYTESL